MPLLTPSRVVIGLLTLTLFTILWSFGVPRPLAQPAPVGKIHTAPIIPAPNLDPTTAVDLVSVTVSAHTPATLLETPVTLATSVPASSQPGDHRWDDDPTRTFPPVSKTISADDRWLDTATTAHVTPIPLAKPSTHRVSKFCSEVRGAPHVMVVVRTSKAETNNGKLAAHLDGLLSCVPSFAIFSDHAGDIDGVPVHDALALTGDAARKDPAFHEYDALKKASHMPDPRKTKDLDKWKFMPMVYQAHRLNPAAKFYVFIEADTALSWSNLLQWTSRLDYRIPYYSGAPSFLNKVNFAQRGSGILLSQGAMRQYAKAYDEHYTTKWEPRLAKECCGDMVLSMALRDAAVEFYHAWPLLQGEHPHTLDFTKKHWCAPAVSWHQMNNESLVTNWASHRNWTHDNGWDTPYLFQDAFAEYVKPIVAEKVENWDNLSSDTKVVAPKGRQAELAKSGSKLKTDTRESPKPLARRDNKKDDKKDKEKEKELDWGTIGQDLKDGADDPTACAKLCNIVDDCIQWRHTTAGDGECHLSKVLRRGSKAENEDDDPVWTSGWIVERVDKAVKEWKCKEPNWKFYQ